MSKKLLTGTVAAAAGLALLLGGGGTLAYWNSSTTSEARAIVAGNLSVNDSGTAGVWKNAAGTTIDIAAYRIVPGDVLTYTKTVLVTAVGDSMTATLSLAPGSIAPASQAAADVALAGRLTTSAVVTATGTGITAGSNGTYVITAGSAGISARAVQVAVTLTFPKDASSTANNDSKTGAVSLGGLAVSLTQN